VARPRAQHRPGREATRGSAIRVRPLLMQRLGWMHVNAGLLKATSSGVRVQSPLAI